MSFLKQFFGSSKSVGEVCQFAVDTGDCSLVQQLKQKQVEKREIDAKIENLESSGAYTIEYFVNFLVAMERHDFRMDRLSGLAYDKSLIYRDFTQRLGIRRLESLLCSMTTDDIDIMCCELKNLRSKSKVIGSHRAQSQKLGDEITKLKTKLGIE